MDVATITMNPNTAREAFRAYRAAAAERGTAEDDQIMRGYRLLARGRTLINLAQSMTTAGVDEKGLPRLAIARADALWCHVRTFPDGSAEFGSDQLPWRLRGRASGRLTSLPVNTLPQYRWNDASKMHRAQALVPLVPLPLRPKGRLIGYHILWEAEWQKVVPRDPFLLRHVGGDLYAVVAAWDLTDLERSVVAGRLRKLP